MSKQAIPLKRAIRSALLVRPDIRQDRICTLPCRLIMCLSIPGPLSTTASKQIKRKGRAFLSRTPAFFCFFDLTVKHFQLSIFSCNFHQSRILSGSSTSRKLIASSTSLRIMVRRSRAPLLPPTALLAIYAAASSSQPKVIPFSARGAFNSPSLKACDFAVIGFTERPEHSNLVDTRQKFRPQKL